MKMKNGTLKIKSFKLLLTHLRYRDPRDDQISTKFAVALLLNAMGAVFLVVFLSSIILKESFILTD